MKCETELWTDFLQSQPTQEVPDDSPVVCDLSSLGLIRVTGDDARDFLQNQFCNDVKLINDNFTQLNGYCNPKGRLLVFFRLYKQSLPEDTYYLSLPKERIAAILKRLQMFVMMSKVTLTDASDELITIGLAGQHAGTLLAEQIDAIPEQTDTCVQWNGLVIIRLPGIEPRFQIIGGLENIRTLWSGLLKAARHAPETEWLLMDIDAGIPRIVDATSEEFVPQMLNLQSINALSFKKGCYPGQEIVARMHYLGKQKRSMYLAQVDTELKPGDSIFEATSLEAGNPGQSVGTVVSAAPDNRGGYRILAVLQIQSARNANLCPENRPEFLLNLKDLPYPVELEGDGK